MNNNAKEKYMNNEEKKPLDGEVQGGEATPSATPVKEGKANAGWWAGLTQGVKIAIIAGAAVLLVAIVLLVVLLAGGKAPDSGDGGNDGGTGDIGDDGGNGGNGGNGGDVKPDDKGDVTYSVKISTVGGMIFNELPVYFYEYIDGDIGDLVHFTTTDADGRAYATLPIGTYAVSFNMGIPDGYEVNSFYPLTASESEFEISSFVLPDTGLTGVTYSLGSIMQDFSVPTTTGETFTLSEALKEKKAVLINFWYTSCSWCVTEFPLMQAAYEKYQDDLAIIALDNPAMANDTMFDIVQFQNNNGLTFDVGIDNLGLFSAFGVEGYPTSVVIDRYGVVTLMEGGAITSERVFDEIFRHFTTDDYEQKLVYHYSDIVPKEKPDVQMPSSEEISNVFDGGRIDGIQYRPYPDGASDEEKEYSWPFVIDEVELDGEIYNVIKTSNANKEGSYAQLLFNVNLNAGEVLAFDYFASTELGADILYVVVNGKDIYSISGQNDNGWETCYAYVAEESGDYEIGLVYQKDSSDNEGYDTVFLKDLRIVSEGDIDSKTYIYRYAATKPDGFGAYSEYVSVFLGSDGYYHVDSPDGPILLADLMGYTRFSAKSTAYYMAVELYESGKITVGQYDLLIDFCSYASNSTLYGVASVTKELKELLDVLSVFYGDPDNANDWLRFCCYYDAYGTDGKQLEDPIKGLATFSAYDVILSEKGATDFPNSFTYNRVIMPRGLLGKFTPEVSGTYLISSYAPDPENEGYGLETNAWVFLESSFAEQVAWYTYENIDRANTGDLNNCYMLLYLEAGKDYYIDIAFYDVYQEGTINYRIERLGDEGYYRFSQTSPGPFTSLLDPVTGALTETIITGIPVELGKDGFWHEKREDGRLGSLIYADFTQFTTIFTGNVIHSDDPDKVDMIDAGAFNFLYSEEDLYVLNYLKKVGGDVERCKAELLAELGEAYNAQYTEVDSYGESYTVTGYAVEEVLAGIYHGSGADETETMRGYAAKIIRAGDTITVVNEDGTGTVEVVVEEGSSMIGCVAVDARLAEILQLLMDKYTFEGVENSWLKLCYYEQYFCAATPK